MELLTLIENVDPTDTAAMDAIDIEVMFFVQRPKQESYMRRGIIWTPSAPKYTRSRDALKSIRPEGWLPFCGNRHYITGHKPFYFGFVKEGLPIGTQRISEDLPTEELAELHAIISAIQWERENE